jgi:hypothetical protein
MVTHIAKITRGNYNRRKDTRITVSSRILTCTPVDGQLGRNMSCPIKEYEETIVKDIAHRRHRNFESEESIWAKEGGINTTLQIIV